MGGPENEVLDEKLLNLNQTYLIITLERFKVVNVVQVSWVSHPLDSLPGGHNPDVLHGNDCVQEQLKTFLVMGSGEPGIQESY